MNYTDPTGKIACGGACVVGIGVAAYRGYNAYKAYNKYKTTVAVAISAAAAANQVYNESSEGTRELGDLEPIHDPNHAQNDPEIGELSDGELGEAIKNPENGDKVTVRGNKVLDGNTRVNEAKSREWASDTPIPVIELPELPDNIDDDPLGPYGD